MGIDTEFQQNSLIYFQGPITVNFISFTANYLQSLLFSEKKLLQEIFRVFVELTQNISYYSDQTWEDKNGIRSGTGWFSVQDLQDRYMITTGNRIKISDGPKLEEYCKEINSLSVEERRKLKRDVRARAMLKDVNAHVGLIQISIISGSNLDYKITAVDKDHSFFTISASIVK
jgi:hypothetical protein